MNLQKELQENCTRLMEWIPELEAYFWFGIPDGSLVSALLRLLSDEEQISVVKQTEYGRKLIEQINGYQRQYVSLTKDIEQRQKQIISQAKKIVMLETMLSDVRTREKKNEGGNALY